MHIQILFVFRPINFIMTYFMWHSFYRLSYYKLRFPIEFNCDESMIKINNHIFIPLLQTIFEILFDLLKEKTVKFWKSILEILFRKNLTMYN